MIPNLHKTRKTSYIIFEVVWINIHILYFIPPRSTLQSTSVIHNNVMCRCITYLQLTSNLYSEVIIVGTYNYLQHGQDSYGKSSLRKLLYELLFQYFIKKWNFELFPTFTEKQRSVNLISAPLAASMIN